MGRPVIGFAGLTHLGLDSAVATAAKGFNVVGYHSDDEMVAQLKNGEPNLIEPQLPELMEKHQKKLSFSCDSINKSGLDYRIVNNLISV